jgi:hypothetical protein
MIAGDWTLEVWFYLDERPAQPLTLLSVDLSELVAGRDLLALQINTDQHPVDPLPRVELQVGRQERAQRLLANDAPVPLRRWVHVAVDSRYNIYLDGWSTQPDLILPQGAQDPVDLTTLYGRAGWHLGLRGSPTEWSLPWNGALRGARVSRGLLYQQNFAPPHPLGTGGATVHVWAMDEGSGTLLRDTQNMQDVPIIDATWSACP